jgi:hypothetical protein
MPPVAAGQMATFTTAEPYSKQRNILSHSFVPLKSPEPVLCKKVIVSELEYSCTPVILGPSPQLLKTSSKRIQYF